MTAEEFKGIFKFGKINPITKELVEGTGSKIQLPVWGSRHTIPVFVDGDRFCGYHFKSPVWCSCDAPWQLYKEPKFEFDWDGEGFWAKEEDDEVVWFEQTSKHLWSKIYLGVKDLPRAGLRYTKSEIILISTPCPPPPNSEDYFK